MKPNRLLLLILLLTATAALLSLPRSGPARPSAPVAPATEHAEISAYALQLAPTFTWFCRLPVTLRR